MSSRSLKTHWIERVLDRAIKRHRTLFKLGVCPQYSVSAMLAKSNRHSTNIRISSIDLGLFVFCDVSHSRVHQQEGNAWIEHRGPKTRPSARPQAGGESERGVDVPAVRRFIRQDPWTPLDLQSIQYCTVVITSCECLRTVWPVHVFMCRPMLSRIIN